MEEIYSTESLHSDFKDFLCKNTWIESFEETETFYIVEYTSSGKFLNELYAWAESRAYAHVSAVEFHGRIIVHLL